MMHLMNSRLFTIMKIVRAGSAVYLLRIKDAGTETIHAKQLSNIKVISVLPPERSVK